MIENTIIELKTNRRGRSVCYISPIDGYKLHDNRLDYYADIEETEFIEGFTTGSVTVAENYNFEENPNNIYAEEV